LTLSASGRIITHADERDDLLAENDKFEHGLPKYWSKAHRLACAQAPVAAIVDEIVRGARRTLWDEASCRAIHKLADVLQHVIDRAPTDVQGEIFGDWDYRFQYLEVRLDELTLEYASSPCMRVVAAAARDVFSALTASEPASETVQDLLAEKITARLIDHRWLSRKRLRLREQCGRTVEQQMQWEAAVLDTLRPLARRLFRTIFREERVPARSPARISERVPLTVEKLHAPLPGMSSKDMADD
jgi:hypothetical protein